MKNITSWVKAFFIVAGIDILIYTVVLIINNL